MMMTSACGSHSTGRGRSGGDGGGIGSGIPTVLVEREKEASPC